MTNILLLIETTIRGNNNLSYIHINSKLGQTLSKLHSPYHAPTSCDYSSLCFSKANVPPFKLLQQDVKKQEILESFAEVLDVSLPRDAERFICKIYGNNSCDKLNGVRIEIFFKNYE